MSQRLRKHSDAGRLRLIGLAALAAAFLLVPAAQALAANPPYHIVFEGSGSGWVKGSEPEGAGGGTPKAECHWNGETATKTGTCDGEVDKVEAFFGIGLIAEADPGSKFVGWKVEEGTVFGGCSNPAFPGEECNAVTLSKSKPIKVKAIFELSGLPSLPLTINEPGAGAGQVNCEVGGGPTVDQPCKASYPKGTELKLIAAPGEGSEFAGYSAGTGSAAGCSASPCSFTIEADSSVTATFNPTALPEFPLTVTKTGSGSGEVTSSPAGIACGGDCEEEYEEGTPVTLTATAAGGSVFTGWSGSGCSGTGSCEVTMSETKAVSANFAPAFTLTVTKEGGEGTVVSYPGGVTCGGTCSAAFETGTPVTLTASPAAGYAFSKWKGCTTAVGLKCEITAVTSSTKVIAYFIPTKTFTVEKAGSGYGKVTSTGISCDESCSTASSAIQSGKVVKVKAIPAKGSKAAVVESETGSAIGNCPGGEAACEFTIEADSSVKVKFEPKPTKVVTLNLTGPGAFKGKVTGKSLLVKGLVKSSLSCGTGCTTTKEAFYEGDEVELTATASAGYSFNGWTVEGGSAGNCIGTTTPCKAPIDAVKTVSAEFK